MLKDSHGNPVDILCPSNLVDVTLSQWQAYTGLSDRESEVEEMEGYDTESMDDDDIELLQLEIRVKRAELLRDGIKCLIPESEHARLDKICIPDLHALDATMLSKEESKPITGFNFPPAMLPDVEEFQKTIPNLGFWDRRKAKKKLADIAKGSFLLIPVAEVQLRARMALDMVQSKSRVLPPAELQAWMDEHEVGVQTLAQALMNDVPTNPDEERAKLRRIKLLNKWGRELEKGEFNNFHKLISHICVPAHDPTYDPVKAQLREPYFLSLSMDVVLGIRDFFVLARKGSALNSKTFSSRIVKNQTPAQKD